MKLFKQIALITVILAVGIFLRFYKLDKIPNGFYVDEAAIGYNAYSFLLTGKDEYGKAFPVFLRSYGAFSSPLYTYLTEIPVKIWGLNIFSVRSLSAFSGVLSIVVFYFLLLRLNLFKNKYASLIGTFLFAVSPWNVFFSRGAFEANLALLFLISGIYFLSAKKKIFLSLILAAICLSVSTYAYQAERLVAYLIFFGYIFLFIAKCNFKKLFKKEIVVAAVLFIFIQLPQLGLSFSPAFRNRATGLFYADVIKTQAEKISKVVPRPIAMGLSFTREFGSQYFSYFSPRNLFFEGDSDLQRSFPLLSVFYPWMVAPYLYGLYLLFNNLKEEKSKVILFLMISFALVPALTKDPFSTLRSLPLVLPFMILITLGIDRLLSGKYKTYWIITGLILFSFVQLWRSCFVLLPKERAKTWSYGYEQLSNVVKTNPDTHFVVEQSRLKPSYIELLFFLKVSPNDFQKGIDSEYVDHYYDSTLVKTDYNFSNVEIRNIDWKKDVCVKQILVGDELAVSENQAKEHLLTKAFEIRDPLGYIVFVGYESKGLKKCVE